MINIKQVKIPENMGQVDFVKFNLMLEDAVRDTVKHARNIVTGKQIGRAHV